MRRLETVILPLPIRVDDLDLAAERYFSQYGIPAEVCVRGIFLTLEKYLCHSPIWLEVLAFDRRRNLLAVGEPQVRLETLLWVQPTSKAELRLRPTLDEEEA